MHEGRLISLGPLIGARSLEPKVVVLAVSEQAMAVFVRAPGDTDPVATLSWSLTPWSARSWASICVRFEDVCCPSVKTTRLSNLINQRTLFVEVNDLSLQLLRPSRNLEKYAESGWELWLIMTSLFDLGLLPLTR